MKSKVNKRSVWIRIVLAVAGKDVIDAIKNRVTISIILGVAMIVLSGQALPLMMKLRPEKRAYVYDPTDSTFVEEFGRGQSHRLIAVPSMEALFEQVGSVTAGAIGLALPEDFAGAGSAPLEIEAFYSHAMRGVEADEMVAFFAQTLSDLLDREVVLNSAGNEVYPGPEAGGTPFMVSISLVVTILTIGMALVPLLMIEEKERHTMEAMLVSPASYGQIVLGKALAGLFYCFLAAAVVYVLNARLLATVWLALLAVLASSFFTVGLGLLFGVLFEQQASMNMVMGFTLMLLMVPVILVLAASSKYPPLLQAVLPWMPSVAMSKLISTSFSNVVDLGSVLFNLVLLFAAAAILLALVVWRVRRMDR